MVEIGQYALYIKLQHHIASLLKDLREEIIKLMSYNPTDMSDPRNMIRRCTHCNEIWIKVEGCDGLTICGERKWDTGWIDSVSTKTMKAIQGLYRYEFSQSF